MNETETRKRNSRYRREPKKVAEPFLSPADLRIFEELLEYRLLTTGTLGELLLRDPKSLQRRLTQLWHHSYIGRRHVFNLPPGIGSPPSINFLGPAAVSVLMEHGMIQSPSLLREWIRRHDDAVKMPRLEHALLLSQFQKLLHLACTDSDDVTQVFFRRDLDDRSLAVKMRVPGFDRIQTIWADGFFLLETAAGEQWPFFLEAETDGGVRRERKRIEDRFLRYQALRQSSTLLRRHFQVDRFFVLFYCASQSGQDTLQRVLRETPSVRGKSLFWFLNAEAAAGFKEPVELFADGSVMGPMGKPGRLVRLPGGMVQ